MKYKNNPSACRSRAEWSQLLQPSAGDDPDPQQVLDQQHLEQCATCRDTLEMLAGGTLWSAEVQSWLAPADDPGPQLESFVERVTASVCALAIGPGNGVAHDPLCEHEIKQLQQLLSPASHPELLGRLGRYELEQLVGRGGMGLVFRAWDSELHRVVAVKTLAVHLIPLATARERFIREARASAGLVHAHIVPVHDVITEGHVPALVMQFIPGPTLEAWLRQRGSMEWAEMLPIAQQLADALAAAHAQGLVHRDVKPGNVLLEAGGSRALLSDFGLVRTLDAATLTRSGMLTGTPDYMSPEQARGEAVTQASDLFSLGAVLYHVLSGHPPFRASDPMAVLNRICHTRHRSLLSSHPQVPREVSRMVDKLLSKDPKRRYGSAVELRDHLQDLSRTTLRLSGRASWWLPVVGAVGMGAVLLAAGLWWSHAAPVGQAHSFSVPKHASGSAAEFTAEIAEASSTDVVQSRASHFETSSFPELMELDPLLEQLTRRTQLLSEEFSTSYDNAANIAPLPFVEFERRVDDLNERLQRLEQEVR